MSSLMSTEFLLQITTRINLCKFFTTYAPKEKPRSICQRT